MAAVANGNGHVANGSAPMSPKAGPKEAAPRSMQGGGVVLEVKSGDTIEVQAGGGPKRKITLSGCNAPRVGFQSNPDEPFAWESREFLREKLIGKQVAFKVARQVGDRDYCEVRYDNKNVALDVLRNGWAKYQPSKENKDAECQEAADEAASKGLGVWGSADAAIKRKIVQLDQGNLGDFLSRNKGKTRECIIEYIRNAGTYRVVLLPAEGLSATPDEYLYCEISLSGVNCPGFRWDKGEEVELTPGSGAKQARDWITPRILGKKLSFRTEGKNADDRAVTLIGSLLHPVKGSIAEFLLEEGHGAYVSWSAEGSSSGPEKLRGCEEKAQRLKKGRWREGGAAAGSSSAALKQFTGKVVEVLSGDQLKIVNAEDKVERRYYVASLRARAAGVKAAQDEWNPYIVEKLRKALVGKGTFSVQVEYAKNVSVFTAAAAKKAAEGQTVEDTIAAAAAGGMGAAAGVMGPPPSDEKTGDLYYVTVYDEKGENMFMKMIEEGLLTVDRGDQTYRSKHFQEYCDTEDGAKDKGKGRHGGKPPAAEQITELILGGGAKKGDGKGKGGLGKKELIERAKGYENQLAGKEFHGTVTYCINGTRFRVKLTHERVLINFQISGVRGPSAGPQNAAASEQQNANIPAREPLGPESLQFARENVMQQDVKVYIERVDPAGTFQGQLFALTKDGKSKKGDLATELLKRGLAYCDQYNTIGQYTSAEAAAKSAKVGIWSDEFASWASPSGGDDTGKVNPALAEGKTFKGQVTYINGIDDFYVVMDKGALNEVTTKVSQIVNKCEVAEASQGKGDGKGKGKGGGLDRNTIYLGQNWDDKKWYRCKFQGAGSDNSSYTVKFIDSGAVDEVDKKAVRKLPAGSELSKLPPAAVHCGLYGVKAPSMDGMWEMAGEKFFGMTGNMKLEVVGVIEPMPKGLTRREQEKEDPSVSKVTLMVGTKCIQEELLKEGVVRLKMKENTPKVVDVNVYKMAQETAKRARINIWKMGDPGDSDDENY